MRPDQLALLPTPPTAPAMHREANLSADSVYRYWLLREWDPALPRLCFIGLNPSTADAEVDDPTIRRLIGYARRWGCGSLWVANLYALRATDPDALLTHPAPVGEGTISNWISWVMGVAGAGIVLVGWGAHPAARAQVGAFVGGFGGLARQPELVCLGTNRDGSPVHPLYQPADARPVAWRAR